jgi:peptidyl-prolyl cis-trans isomerase B (cyclophilin B)
MWSCNPKQKSTEAEPEKRVTIEMETDFGTIVLELYNETPKHRDNFIKIAKDGVLDSVLFHRVIEQFMIQAGDPDSKNAQPGDTLGNGGLDYKVDAEFTPALFHKKGVLAAARDGNPERASSSTQFYIVQGKVFNDSLLNESEIRINGWLAEYYVRRDPNYKTLVDDLQKARTNKNEEGYKLLSDSLAGITKIYTNFEHYSIPEEHREVYKTLGGTPHLDQNYTVFGEVIKGIDIVDSIAQVQTGEFNRPLNDVRILRVRVLE